MAQLAKAWDRLQEEQKKIVRTFWPSPQEYNEAVQNPKHSFGDPQLADGSAELDKFGIPRPYTGMFASVYKIDFAGTTWALRFFLHNIPDQVERYSAISEALSSLKSNFFVDFDFQEEGLVLHGTTFPILKMHWCGGEDLLSWLKANLTQTSKLEKLLKNLQSLSAALGDAGIAHGDLQHGNILMEDDSVKLIDYDGMFVPALGGRKSNELGHRNYQHPQRTELDFNSSLDNFSFWLIYLSIKMIKHDPGLFWELRGGDDCLLFRAQDLESPAESDAFFVLESHVSEEVRNSARLLRYLRSLPIADVPSLGASIDVPSDFEQIVEEIPEDELSDEIRAESEPGDLSDTYSSNAYLFRSNKRKRSRKKGGGPGGRAFGARSMSAEKIEGDASPRLEKAGEVSKDNKANTAEVFLEKLAASAVNLNSSSSSSLPAASIAQSALSTNGSATRAATRAKMHVDTSWAAVIITLVLCAIFVGLGVWSIKGNSGKASRGHIHSSDKSLMIRPVDWRR